MDAVDMKILRDQVLKLIERKERLEKEIEELFEILSKNNVGMEDPLVDAEQFPLPNIDVYQVRHARHLINCKQNDHKQLMKKIEEGVAKYYETEQPAVLECNESTNNEVRKQSPTKEDAEPFATISIVHPGSPADVAGICNGDLIVEFGSVNAGNFKEIGDIGAVVQHSRGIPINVRIKRGHNLIRLKLVPREWDGRGLLGCNVQKM